MALLRRSFSSALINRLRNSSLLLHTQTESNNDTAIINTICDALRNRHDWDTLSSKFTSVQLTDSLVEKVLLRLKDPVDAKQALGFFHWSAKTNNHNHHVCSYSIAVHILVKAKMIHDAKALIESMVVRATKDRCSSTFTVVDSLLASYGMACSSPLVFDLLVQCYAKRRMLDIGYDVCLRLSENGFSLSLISFNTLIHVIQKSGENDLIWRVYEHMIETRTYPNEATIKSMVSALCKTGELKVFVDMLDRIHSKRCPPSMIVNTFLIYKTIEEGRTEVGVNLLKRLLQKNMILDTVAFSLVVYAKVKLGDIESARQVYEEMLNRGFEANSFVHTSFIKGYCNEGKIEEVNNLLLEMENLGMYPYAETFDVIIQGCVRVGRDRESLSHCERMIEKGFVPSCSSFNLMVEKINKEIENVKRANQLLTLIIDNGFVPDGRTYSLMICGYVKGDEIEEALKLFYEMEYRRIAPGSEVFESLIIGLCRSGRTEEGEKYMRRAKKRLLELNLGVYEEMMVGHSKKGLCPI